MLPNILTTLRIILAIPIAVLILHENYAVVLGIAFIAGLSDAVDGYLARKFNAVSYYGGILDPLADKALLLSAYIAFALGGLLPSWVTILLLSRDLLIVSGAVLYRCKFDHYKMAPSFWGKSSTFVQIIFALLLLMQQISPLLSKFTLQLGLWLVILMALVSGIHYIYIWAGKLFSIKTTK
ncbi:MAG: CDP-alcohol phosphatidyltransferase family protein [Psychromonas sp.]|nr:CDP-alcohol phosphatidyltransferase family protein [Psychromonas sp.]